VKFGLLAARASMKPEFFVIGEQIALMKNVIVCRTHRPSLAESWFGITIAIFI